MLSVSSQTLQQKLSSDFFKELKNKNQNKFEQLFDTSVWGKLLAYQVKQQFYKNEDECGVIKSIKEILVDTQGCKIATATHVKTNKGNYYYYLLFDQNNKIQQFYADTLAPNPFYVKPSIGKGLVKKEISIISNSKISLPATLYLPDNSKSFPVVIIVHGSGPHDRNGTIIKNKIYLDLALGLTQKGIAVLLYDKRTYVYKYNSQFPKDSMTYYEETIEDALAAVNTVRKIKGVDSTKIFVGGHSQGAMCAPKIASLDTNKYIFGIIMLASPARSLLEIMPEQIDYVTNDDSKMTDIEKMQVNSIKWQINNAKSDKLDMNTKAGILPFGIGPKYWLYDRKFEAVKTAQKINIPILLLQGSRDYNVTTKEYDMWLEAMKERKNFSSKLYPKLNHMFFEGEGMSTPKEMMKVGHVANYVMEDIADWINRFQ